HVALQHRIDVCEEEEFRVHVVRWDLRIEIAEDVQLRVERLGFVEILAVLASPEEALPFGVNDAGRINTVAAKNIFVLSNEVFTHNCDHTDFREIAGGEGEVSSGASENTVYFSRRSLNRIVGNRAYYNNRHSDLCSCFEWLEIFVEQQREFLARFPGNLSGICDDRMLQGRPAFASALPGHRGNRIAHHSARVLGILIQDRDDLIHSDC